MLKRHTYWILGAGLTVSGCSTLNDVGEAIPDALGRSSLMYRINVQQGNVVEQAMINRLEPGLSKSQVRYVMGSPLLVDVFHQDRWDYYYSMGKGRKVMEQKRITLFFEDDRLVRLEGDLRPQPPEEITEFKEARVYSVPDHNKRTGIIGGVIDMVDGDPDSAAGDKTGTVSVEGAAEVKEREVPLE